MNPEKEVLSYTMVLHQARKRLKLKITEYCVADTIYHLSNNPTSQIKGWCYATKETIAGYLGLSAVTIWTIIEKLKKKGLLERNPDDNRYLRTTQDWYDNVVLYKLRLRGRKEYKETLGSLKKLKVDPKETLDRDPKETLDNKDNTYNNNIKTTIEYKEYSREIKQHLHEVVMYYGQVKKFGLDTLNPNRYYKSAKALLIELKDVELVKRAIDWMASSYKQKKLDWTIETLVKHLDDFRKERKTYERIRKVEEALHGRDNARVGNAKPEPEPESVGADSRT